MAFWYKKDKKAVDREAWPHPDTPLGKTIDAHRTGKRTSFSDMGASCEDATKLLFLNFHHYLNILPNQNQANILADYIRSITEPTRIEVKGQFYFDECAKRILAAAGENAQIKEIAFPQATEEVAKTVANALHNNSDLVSIFLGQESEKISQETRDAFNTVITNKSCQLALTSFSPTDILNDDAKAVLERNREIANQVWPKMQSQESPRSNICKASLAVGIHGFAAHRSAGTHSMNASECVLAVMDFVHNELPKPKVDDINTLDDLTEIIPEGEKWGMRVIDNPHFLNIFPEVAKKLEATGTPITKEFLMQPNPDGEPTICNVIHAGKFEDVLAYLNKRGERITAEDFTSEIFLAFRRTTQGAALFTEENLQSKQEIRALRQKLPNLLPFEPQNLHALNASLRQRETLKR